jgi:hypothetical protein
MAVDISILTVPVAAASALGAVVLWTVQTVRKPAPDAPRSAPRLALTALDTLAFVLVVAAVAPLAWRAFSSEAQSVEELALLMLPGAVLLRAYRLARAGSPAVHRLAGVLALVAGAGLLIDAAAWSMMTDFRLNSLGTMDLAAGALALTGGAVWLRRP